MDLIRAIAKPLHSLEIIEYVSTWKDDGVRGKKSIFAMTAIRLYTMPTKRTIASSCDF